MSSKVIEEFFQCLTCLLERRDWIWDKSAWCLERLCSVRQHKPQHKDLVFRNRLGIGTEQAELRCVAYIASFV